MTLYTWADIVIFAIIILSFLISLMRGFVKEVLSLFVWILAFYVAYRFSGLLTDSLSHYIQTPSLQVAAAFALVFIAMLLMGALINFFLVKIVHSTGLTGTDRLLGAVFGVARGVVIAAVLIWFGQMTPVKEDSWWKQSVTIPHVQRVIDWVQAEFPIAKKKLSEDIKVNNDKD